MSTLYGHLYRTTQNVVFVSAHDHKSFGAVHGLILNDHMVAEAFIPQPMPTIRANAQETVRHFNALISPRPFHRAHFNALISTRSF